MFELQVDVLPAGLWVTWLSVPCLALYKLLGVFNSFAMCIYCMLQAQNVLSKNGIKFKQHCRLCKSAVLVCIVEQTSTSLFDIVIWMNFLVSLYCCESILYFTNIWNKCWNDKVLWLQQEQYLVKVKYTLISSHFLCTTSSQTILYKILS